MGEFGVVLMVGGNIPGVTRTVSIDIYDKVQAVNYAGANATALVLLADLVCDALGGVRPEPAGVDVEVRAGEPRRTRRITKEFQISLRDFLQWYLVSFVVIDFHGVDPGQFGGCHICPGGLA